METKKQIDRRTVLASGMPWAVTVTGGAQFYHTSTGFILLGRISLRDIESLMMYEEQQILLSDTG